MPRAPRLRRCRRVSDLRQRRLQAVNSNEGIQEEGYEKTTPAWLLPTEVTCAIFEAALGPSPFFTGGQSLPGSEVIAISQVCRTWRDIALDYTPLWTTFAYSDKGPMSNLNQEMVLSRLQLHLDRSGGRPVDLWVDAANSQLSDKLYDAFTEHMGRWRRVALQLNPSSDGVPLRIAQPDLAPNLEAFALANSRPTSISYFPFPNFTLNAPKLDTLRMDFRAFKTWAPTTTITRLDIDQWCHSHSAYLPWSTFLDIISSPALKSLMIRALPGGVMFKAPTSSDMARRVDTNLEDIHCTEVRVAHTMWGFIRSAPRLRTISFFHMGVHRKWDIQEAANRWGLNLFGKDYDLRFPVLKSVSMIDCVVSKLNLECLAKLTPHVVSFGVFAVKTTQGMPIDTLMSREERSVEDIMWPKLDFVRANIKDIKQAQYDSYSKFLLGRSALKKPCTLLLYTPEADRWKEQDVRGWKKLENRGLVHDLGQRVVGQCI
ncbi:unnamed protein product [Cyclocybe aegerita]|uniref:F-box domain-containing protein n=1 Tax=Cyclocybe aegerita TaxID=1973307 RepID=A0A8S0XNA1_CYCAE|nr:unnamed protein product [Cyclocybe aegerita]